jgi:hypothetical protein
MVMDKKYRSFLSSLAVQNDGKIVAAGSAIARYNVDGTPDNTLAETEYRPMSFRLLQQSFK